MLNKQHVVVLDCLIFEHKVSEISSERKEFEVSLGSLLKTFQAVCSASSFLKSGIGTFLSQPIATLKSFGFSPKICSLKNTASGTTFNLSTNDNTGMLKYWLQSNYDDITVKANSYLSAAAGQEATLSVVREVIRDEVKPKKSKLADKEVKEHRSQYGLKIKVRPRVIQTAEKNKIALDIDMSYDTYDMVKDASTPDIVRRQLHTTAIVEDGERVLLGGLNKEQEQEDKKDTAGWLPWFPGRSANKKKVSSDLYMVVSPKLLSADDTLSGMQKNIFRPGDSEEFLMRKEWANRTSESEEIESEIGSL